MGKTTTIIFVLIVVAAVILYWQFVWKPVSKKLADKREEYQKVSTELRKTEVVAAKLEKVQRTYDLLVKRWEEAKVMLPKKKEIPTLLEGITTAGMKSGIKFDLFEPQSILPRGIYSEVPIRVGVTGDFHEIGRFFSAVGNLPRIVNISDLKMKGSKEKKLAVDFNAITYMITESGGIRHEE